MTQDKALSANSKSKSQTRPAKKPKKITESYLHNSGLYYLERFSSSSANFRSVMIRKVKRSCMAHPEQSYEKCAAMVDALVKKFINTGLLDDETYTRAKVSSLRRRGKSARAIQSYLKAKGLEEGMIDRKLKYYDKEHYDTDAEAELEAAMTFARKKRLGPFRVKQEYSPEKELRRMAMAGFSYDTSRTVLEMNASDTPAGRGRIY